MQHFTRHNYRKFIGIIGIALLAAFLHSGISLLSGFLSTDINVNLVSAQLAPQMLTYSAFEPANRVEQDTQPVELGVKFRSDVNGEIKAIKFYRGVAIDSGYIANLWRYPDGKLLGQGRAVEGQQPAPGWQTVQLYPPVPIQAGQIYIASYYASQGQYSEDQGDFIRGIRRGPIYFLADGEEGPNGVHFYGLGGGFPTQGHNASNYWVDVVFTPTPSAP